MTVLIAGVAPSAGAATPGAPTPVSPSPEQAVVAAPAAGAYTPLAAQRLLDTRNGNGAPVGAIPAGGTVSVVVTGRGGVPATGVGAVAVTVTVVTPASSGYVVAYPTGTARPGSSNVNFGAGRTVSNLVVVPVGTGGRISLSSSARTHAIVDVSGWYATGTSTGAGTFAALPPRRVLDTRSGTGAPRAVVPARDAVTLSVAGRGGVPARGVGGVLLNVTVTAPAAAGYVTVYAAGTARPVASVVNYVAGQTVADAVFAPVSADGRVVLYTSAATQLVADVSGYVLAGTASAPGAYHPVAPARLFDNRSGGVGSQGVPAEVLVTGRAGVPATGVDAVAIVLTSTQRNLDGAGSVVVYRGGGARPATTNLSHASGQTIADAVLAPVGPDGRVRLLSGAVNSLIVDVVGWVAAAPVPMPAWGATAPVDGYGGGVEDVSCGSASSCVAVDAHGQAVRWDGATWSQPVQVTPRSGDNELGLVSVSCPTAALCFAHDSDNGIWRSAADGWTRWATLPSSFPGDSFACTVDTCLSASSDNMWWTDHDGGWFGRHVFGVGTAVEGVDCAGATCVTVGADGRASTLTTQTGWTPAVAVADATQLRLVSCATEAACVAIGANPAGETASYRLAGGGWRSDGVVPGGPDDLSCAGDTCVAGGLSPEVLARTGTGDWQVVGEAPGVGHRQLACGATASCQVVSDDGLGIRFDGVGLVDPAPVDPETSQFRVLACRSRTSCSAVGSRNDIREFDGRAWTTASRAFGPPTDVSCASGNWCGAVGRSGRAILRTAAGWGPITQLASDVQFVSVSCPVEGWCLAGDQLGGVYVGDPQGWRPTTVLPTHSDVQLACTSRSFCLGHVGGASFRFDGKTWSRIAGPPGAFRQMDCASPTFCVASAGGRLYQWDGVGWDDGQTVSSSTEYPGDVSCVRGGVCLVPSGRRVLASSGVTWAASTPTALDASIAAIGCAPDGSCLALSYRNAAVLTG
ncbi:hypothetical protein ACXR2U_03320 [Jatrophihabitans sp. YIM 134969]